MHTLVKSSTFAAGFKLRAMSKRIAYISPIDWVAGSLSGHESYSYDGEKAYTLDNGLHTADTYTPKLIAKVRYRDTKRYFCVRTRTSVNMNTETRASMAVLGGAGAIYCALVRDKSSAIYIACYTAFLAQQNMQLTFRAFIMRALMNGLKTKVTNIQISTGVSIVNPWVSSDTPNVPIASSIITKFNSILS